MFQRQCDFWMNHPKLRWRWRNCEVWKDKKEIISWGRCTKALTEKAACWQWRVKRLCFGSSSWFYSLPGPQLSHGVRIVILLSLLPLFLLQTHVAAALLPGVRQVLWYLDLVLDVKQLSLFWRTHMYDYMVCNLLGLVSCWLGGFRCLHAMFNSLITPNCPFGGLQGVFIRIALQTRLLLGIFLLVQHHLLCLVRMVPVVMFVFLLWGVSCFGSESHISPMLRGLQDCCCQSY